MGWFDEQIKQRKLNDDELLAAAYSNVASAVLGRKVSAALADGSELARDAIEHILKYYHIKSKEIPAEVKDINSQLEFLLRPYGIMRRPVKLTKGWYKDALGAMLGTRTDDGSVVALIPMGMGSYSFYDAKIGKKVRITAKNEDLIDVEALCFYKPFPLRKITLKDLLLYMREMLSLSDLIFYLVLTFIGTLLGMLTPLANKLLFGTVIEMGSYRLLLATTIMLVSSAISTMLINAVKSMVETRIHTKMDVAVEAATMMRVLSLPTNFFRDYSAGELSAYTQHVNSLCNILIGTILNTTVSSLFSLIYVTQIYSFAPALVNPAMAVIAVTLVFTIVSSVLQMNISKQIMKLDAKAEGLSFALLNGIQKIKMAGAEKRAFAKWANLYAQSAKLEYNPPMIIKVNSVIGTAITLFGTIILYYAAAISKVSVADYYAFNSAYGMVAGAFMSLSSIALTVANIKPILDMAKPIMDAEPEISEGKQVVTRISGSIELSHVSFKYSENSALILDDLSLKIKSGQYVAIVGKTGCGKSTLMRLLLGFEKPSKGAIYYDNKDMASLDLKSLRKKIGVVIQNGKLFTGSIFENIIISAPMLTLNDAWDAAEKAGLADDIRQMPMGMHTLICEGQGGISGGQKQRVMIARAIAPKPKVLMFDEATSALDNITQKKVSQSLDALKCTRIVIAHRLSTIKECDRILVLDGGKIVEDGTYDQLIAAGGFFAELVERQRVEI